MNYFISIIMPILLFVVAIIYLYHFNYRQLKFWRKEITYRKVFEYITVIFIKSAIAFTLVIFVHNSFHDDHLLELTLFVLIFFIFSVIQSGYSLSGFLNRNKLAYSSFIDYFHLSSTRLNKFINSIDDRVFFQAKTLVKVLIITLFVVLFIPNVSLFITTNVLFLLFIGVMVGLALLQNNVIYFGFMSLMVFQYYGEAVAFDNLNLFVLIPSFLILLVGITLETRLERRMFDLINVMPVKRFNFKLGYDVVYDRRQIIMYQNMINHYYYVYYRKIGVVVVYHSDIDPKVSNIVLNKMISFGNKYLRQHDIN